MSLEIRLQHAIADRRLMTYQPGEILPAVNQILLQTYVLLGFSPPKDGDLGILIAKLSADLQESYPSLTLPEVALCFELGAKGEYGDFMGLKPCIRAIPRRLSARTALPCPRIPFPASPRHHPRFSGSEARCHATGGRLQACRKYGHR
jgi:hypothetical protein